MPEPKVSDLTQIRWAIKKSAQTRRELEAGVDLEAWEVVGNVANLLRVMLIKEVTIDNQRSKVPERLYLCLWAELERMTNLLGDVDLGKLISA